MRLELFSARRTSELGQATDSEGKAISPAMLLTTATETADAFGNASAVAGAAASKIAAAIDVLAP